MRNHYRTLQAAIAPQPRSLSSLIRTLKTEELLALCVFSQLSFFVFEPESQLVSFAGATKSRTLNESSLYRIVHKTQEA